ncbi:hypothetical protein, partial [Mycobacterium avium]|uniref:hypothetical protein n=1 Tax=Mycobacterium avium TaxID=1764 RepID=UPI001F4168A3
MNIVGKSNGFVARNPATRRQSTSQYGRKSVVGRTFRQPIHFRHTSTSWRVGTPGEKTAVAGPGTVADAPMVAAMDLKRR